MQSECAINGETGPAQRLQLLPDIKVNRFRAGVPSTDVSYHNIMSVMQSYKIV